MEIRIQGGVEVDDRTGWYYRTRVSSEGDSVAMYIGDEPEDIIRWLKDGSRLNRCILYWVCARCSVYELIYGVLERDMRISSFRLRE